MCAMRQPGSINGVTQLLVSICITSSIAYFARSATSPLFAYVSNLAPLLLPDCVRFDCCSLIASDSTAAPPLHPLVAFQPIPNVLVHSSGSLRFSKLKYRGRMSLD